MHEAVLDHRGLRPDAHDLVGLRPVGGGGVQAVVDELLDQLRAARPVLDQDDISRPAGLLRFHPALQFRVVEALAHDIEEIEVPAGDAPDRAHAEIGEFGRLVGGVLAGDDALELPRRLLSPVAGEPGRLDEPAAKRRRRLLVLAGKVVFADPRDKPGDAPDAGEGSAEGYARISGRNGRTAPIASKNCDSVACRSSARRLLPARRPVSGACPDIRPSNRPSATRISTASVFPASLSLPRLNPIEPPWYGPVCPVVWEGRCREASPYPDRCPRAAVRKICRDQPIWVAP
jgi:hypothetical protein